MAALPVVGGRKTDEHTCMAKPVFKYVYNNLFEFFFSVG
jgi:hypothetical protein